MQAGNHLEVFLRPLANKASAIVFFNRHRYKPYQYSFSLEQLNLTEEYEVSAAGWGFGGDLMLLVRRRWAVLAVTFLRPSQPYSVGQW